MADPKSKVKRQAEDPAEGQVVVETAPDTVAPDHAATDASPTIELSSEASPPPSSDALSDPAGQTEVTAETLAEPVSVPTLPKSSKRASGGFFGMVFGGVVAAGLGFGLAQYGVPEGWPLGSSRETAAQIAQQAEALTNLRADIKRLEGDLAAASDAAPDAGRIAALEAALSDAQATLATQTEALARIEAAAGTVSADIASRLAGLETRIKTFEELPLSGGDGISSATIIALNDDLAALRAEVQGQQGAGATLMSEIEAAAVAANARLAEAEAQAAALKTEAEASAKVAATRAALSRVQAAVDSGAPYGSALANLQAAGIDLPQVLVDGASGGLPTLPNLQATYPQAARAGLEASLKADMGEGFGDRVASFLRATTGARSLTPREGGDPDAVLSRAEAALRDGDLAKVLTEVATLPAPGQQAMAAWVAQAQSRLQAAEAVEALASALDVQ